ncbi:MAG: HAD hydrolase family protein, partial [Patescibacteria group bacterium]
GYTTVDVTKKGIDKAYGLKQIQKYLKVPFSKMLFVGDALYKGGNDYAVIKTGVDYISVSGPRETKRIISEFLKS